MPRILRTDTAEADVLDIYRHIAADNPRAADKWLEKIDRTLGLAAKFPGMGEQVEHLAPGLRRLTEGNYLLFYVPIEGGIELQRVLHGARRIEDLF
jgi:toxin ParE1/3/4